MKVSVEVVYNKDVKGHNKLADYFMASQVEVYNDKIRLLDYRGRHSMLDILFSDIHNLTINREDMTSNLKRGE